MQKTKIVVGEEYLVDIDGLLSGPLQNGSSEPVPFNHGYTFRGVSKRYGTRVRATVKALGAVRPEQSGSWSRYTRTTNDGVLVEFAEPQASNVYSDRAMITTAVLDTRHILRLWSEFDQEQRAAAEWKITQQQKADEQAAAFRPEIERVQAALVAKGFDDVGMYGDESGITFNGGSLSMNRAECSDGVNHAVGWGARSNIYTEEFVRMLLG